MDTWLVSYSGLEFVLILLLFWRVLNMQVLFHCQLTSQSGDAPFLSRGFILI